MDKADLSSLGVLSAGAGGVGLVELISSEGEEGAWCSVIDWRNQKVEAREEREATTQMDSKIWRKKGDITC